MQLHELIRRLLIVWVGTAMLLLLVSILVVWFTGGNLHDPAIPISDLWGNLANGNAQAWMTLVLILLLIAPAATVFVAFIQSLITEKRREAVTAMIVLGILLSSLWLG